MSHTILEFNKLQHGVLKKKEGFILFYHLKSAKFKGKSKIYLSINVLIYNFISINVYKYFAAPFYPDVYFVSFYLLIYFLYLQKNMIANFMLIKNAQDGNFKRRFFKV